jgi:nitric-oxide synthase
LIQTYVQDLIIQQGENLSRQILEENGHVYVCGDCTMAEDVYQTLKRIVQEKGQMNDNEIENFMLSLRVSPP